MRVLVWCLQTVTIYAWNYLRVQYNRMIYINVLYIVFILFKRIGFFSCYKRPLKKCICYRGVSFLKEVLLNFRIKYKLKMFCLFLKVRRELLHVKEHYNIKTLTSKFL